MNYRNKHIHFIGIGGAGMSGLAQYFLAAGAVVSGSDLTDSAITRKLAEAGAKIFRGHNSNNLPDNTDIVIYTSAVKSSENPELLKAEEMGIKIVRRAEILGEIVNDKFLVAISGTHGKTTTTAMIGKLLEDADMDPLVFVGGNVSLFGGKSCRYGNGKYAVVEADEYDRSFHQLRADIAVITNVDEDHLDIYKNITEIKESFEKFCNLSKDSSFIIYYGDDVNITDFIHRVNRRKISYGFDKNNDLILSDINVTEVSMTYSILNSNDAYKGIRLNIPGRHNALNSVACFAVSKVLGIDIGVFKSSINSFKTVDRRLQLKYNNKSIRVFDDYAHHPSEVRSSINALREISSGRIITVFQPHLYSRTKDFYSQFARELANSDMIILTDIYPAREKPIEGVSSGLIFKALAEKNKNVFLIESRNDILIKLINEVKSGDIIVFQGAGDVNQLCDEFILQLKSLN